MSEKNLLLVIAALSLAAACGDDASPDTSPVAPTGDAAAADGGSLPTDGGTLQSVDGGSASSPANDAGGTSAAADGSAPPPAPPVGGYDYENQAVSLTTDLVIPSGKTVTVGPGVTFTAQSANVKVLVEGTLVVQGSAGAPSRFVGTAEEPRKWTGIVVNAGGTVHLAHAVVSGATFAFHALPGSHYTVEDSTLSASFKAAVVEADGSFERTHFVAAPSLSFSLTNEVSIDDENGTLTVIGASPTVTNSMFDGASAFVDMVRVGGEAKPVFDHVHVRNAHCAFHVNGAINNSPIIRNSIIENQSYGVMAYRGKPVFENCVFRKNTNDYGFCFDATADNAPVLTNNFYASGTPAVDSTCFQIGTAEPKPATAEPAGVGPVGLSL